MVRRWDLTDTLFCDDEATAMAEHKQGDYVEYDDYLKLADLCRVMLEDMQGEGMHTEYVEERYKELAGDPLSGMAKLHASIMEPVIERCKKALEATNE